MDSSIKAVISIFIAMMGITLLVSCINFCIVHNNAINILYATIQEVEIYGNDGEIIQTIENDNNVSVCVEMLQFEKYYQYKVDVNYSFSFGFMEKTKTYNVNGLTRLFER